MPLILPGNVGSATAATGYDVANSCRFNPADSAFVHKTPDAGDRQKATFSCWIKRSLISSAQTLFWAGSDNSNYQTFPRFLANDKIVVAEINSGSTTWEIFTNRVFRDTSAWYHIVVAMDTTQATAANRVKIYVNGVQETSLNIDGGYPAENRSTLINTAVPHQIAHDYVAQYYGGYVAEACFIEGSQNAPTDFGEFDDSGIWKPIDVSGLTFGTNGFYLDFEASDNLGNDANGGTDLTESGLAATDQSIDTCTNNFATMNPLDNFFPGHTFSEGNLKIVTTSNESYNTSTIGVSSGKWYFEVEFDAFDSGVAVVGIIDGPSGAVGASLHKQAQGWGYRDGGDVKNNDSAVSGTWASYTTGDIIGIALDLDNNRLFFSKNGAFQNSGDPTTSTGAITITAPSSLPNGNYFFAIGDYNTGTATLLANFGSPPFAISSGNTDGEGFGNFEFPVPSGYFALCTKNLAEYG